MISRKKMTAFAQRELAAEEAEPTIDDAGLTPHQKLLRAAESGRFEALVRKARPAEPLAMVTPQEREAELRQSGRWPAEKPEPRHEPKQAPQPAPAPAPAAEMTPNEQYLAEHCRWRRRGPHDHAYRRQPSSCLTDYDPLADTDEGDE